MTDQSNEISRTTEAGAKVTIVAGATTYTLTADDKGLLNAKGTVVPANLK
ncbi:hypothetical protein [Neobacillus terrae]|nr:hypothetical protein [Neobacillus terrae]NHM31329.1 hypothetical protein [Neobacillus terrae]